MALIDGPCSPEQLEAERKHYAELTGRSLEEVKVIDYGGAAVIVPVDVNPRMTNLTVDGVLVADEVVGREVPPPVEEETPPVENEDSLLIRIANLFRRSSR